MATVAFGWGGLSCAGGESSPVGDPGRPTTLTPDATTGPESTPTSSTTQTRPTPCAGVSDCDDGDPCTLDRCKGGICSHPPVACDDGLACTLDRCDPTSGQCVHQQDPDACDDRNACPNVHDCTCMAATNLAREATPSSSGGGVDEGEGYGPQRWIDGEGEASCMDDPFACDPCFGWVQSNTGEGWMQLSWATPVEIESMVLDGMDESTALTCLDSARMLTGGTVEVWDAENWVPVDEFSNASGDIELSFSPPLRTTRIRVSSLTTSFSAEGVSNPVVFEWYVYSPTGCSP